MNYSIENELLKVTVTTEGAQICSVKRKCDDVEHIWQADPALWPKHGPILFPYPSRIRGGFLTIKGKQYPADIHGFAKNMEHSLVSQNENTVVLELKTSRESLALWPYEFRLVSTFTLEGDILHHTLTVENPGDEDMQFGIGYHPGFAVPFDDAHTATDYELRFDCIESPLCLKSSADGRFGETTYVLGHNIDTIPLDEHLFDNDSHCMVALKSHTLGLYEKDTGRGVVCGIKGFPYTLIWSKPGMPRFVCIEPWHAIPSPQDTVWEEKPATAKLAPGESWDTTLSMSFVR